MDDLKFALRHLLVESAFPAILEGGLGVRLARWSLVGWLALQAADSPRRDEIRLDGSVLQTKTILGLSSSSFTLNGQPSFLYGISYYGALGATEDFIRRDLDDMQRYGFNWIRVWANWRAF